jgi:hypothetical protein
LWIWIASSRVGARISARGSSALRSASAGRSAGGSHRDQEGQGLAGAGLGLAGDVAAGSASGRVRAWIGVQRVKPAASSPASSAGCRSNEEKVTSVNGLSDMGGLRRDDAAFQGTPRSALA